MRSQGLVRTSTRGGVALATLLVVSFLGAGCDHKAPLKKARRTAVVSPVESGPLSTGVVAPGIVEPWDGEVRVAAKEAGWIADIAVHEGQTVRAGERLAGLDAGAQRAAVDVATAEVAESEALLERTLRGPTPEELEQARAEGAAAEARAAGAASDANRLGRLAEAGVVARAVAEDARHTADAAAASASAYSARYAAARRGSRVEDIAAARRRLDSARARRHEAEEALARRVVVAPVAGTILWSRYRPGEFYTAGSQALFVLGDVGRLQVRVDVDEIDAERIAVGANATIRLAAAGLVRAGRVVSTSPRMGRKNLLVETPTARNDVRIREVLVEAAPDRSLLPGLRVWVSIDAPPAG